MGWHRRGHDPGRGRADQSCPTARCTTVAPPALTGLTRSAPMLRSMITPGAEWERRMADLWAAFDDHEPADFLAKVKELTDELPEGDAVAEYELGSAYDSIDRESEAAAHYRRAFAAGLPEDRRRSATIQYASTLRNLGRAEESAALLTAERGGAFGRTRRRRHRVPGSRTHRPRTRTGSRRPRPRGAVTASAALQPFAGQLRQGAHEALTPRPVLDAHLEMPFRSWPSRGAWGTSDAPPESSRQTREMRKGPADRRDPSP